MLDSLVRVSRRIEWNKAQTPQLAQQQENFRPNGQILRPEACTRLPVNQLQSPPVPGKGRAEHCPPRGRSKKFNFPPSHWLGSNLLWRRKGRMTARPHDHVSTRLRLPTRKSTSERANNHTGRNQRAPRSTTSSIRLPPDNFTHFLTLSSKSFSTFPHGTCSLSVSQAYLALDGAYHPFRVALTSNSTPRRHQLSTRTPTRACHPLRERGRVPTDLGSSKSAES